MTGANLLDAAAAAREVATFVALAMLATGGDGGAAIELAEELACVAPAEGDELDCCTIGAQAIRDAIALRGAA